MRHKIAPLLVVISLLAACGKTPEPLQTVTITHADGRTTSVTVDIADDTAERTQGLMGRTDLADRHGMFFIFPQQQPLNFWMKNTPLFLDIIFIDQDHRIVHIHPKARPFDESLIPSRSPARYVLEIKGGESARYSIRVGDRVDLHK